MESVRSSTVGRRPYWDVPAPATRALLATSVGHVLPPIARTAEAIGLTVASTAQLLDLVDSHGGRRLALLFQRLARVPTDAEAEALRVVTVPPAGGTH